MLIIVEYTLVSWKKTIFVSIMDNELFSPELVRLMEYQSIKI